MALGTVVAVLLAGCAQAVREASWDDLVTARQQDAIDRGWVPEWLPEAATDLAQANRPESGEVVLRATLPADRWLDTCTPTDDAPSPPDVVGWWQPPDEPPQRCRATCASDDADVTDHCEEQWWSVRAEDTIWTWTTGDEGEPVAPSPTDAVDRAPTAPTGAPTTTRTGDTTGPAPAAGTATTSEETP